MKSQTHGNQFTLTVDFHQGKTIMATARTYPNLLRVIAEVVQNSIDGGANRIELNINIPGRTFCVYDNGSGCGKEMFQRALHSLNSSMKTKDKFGQFGRGLVAPLSVAEHFDFTSCASPLTDRYFKYRFAAGKIESQEKVEIPGFEPHGLRFDPATSKGDAVWWRTAVEAEKLTKDHRLTTITMDLLLEDLALKFGDAIRSRDIKISITLTDREGEKDSKNVIAPEFTGEKMALEDVMGESAAGKTSFELYIAKLGRSGRKGNIVFGTTENPSRISAEQFVVSTRPILRSEVGQTLMSGIFEGKILCQNIELDPDRTRFRENDALVELCVLIEAWYDQVGKEAAAEARGKDSDNRFQRLGKSVMPFAELLLRQTRFQHVKDGIKIGTIGNGHVDVPRRDVIGPDSGTATALTAQTYEKGRVGDGKGDEKTAPKKEHKDHHPSTIYGNGGRKRTEVRGSTGLRFAYIEMEDITIPFEFDPERGTLTFNLDHPNWSQCEESDATLLKYQMAVIMTAMNLELSKSGKHAPHPEVIEFAYRSLSEQAFAIANGEAMLARK